MGQEFVNTVDIEAVDSKCEKNQTGMRIRKLEDKDASLMLAWMHDPVVVNKMRTNFGAMTLSDCDEFIFRSKRDMNNLHMAITNEKDEYMGTVSLKHIARGKAEFGITIRREGMGKGYSRFGMNRMLEKGFCELNLTEIYWCVNPENTRALKFYKKNKYIECVCPEYVNNEYSNEEKKYYLWYKINKTEWINKTSSI